VAADGAEAEGDETGLSDWDEQGVDSKRDRDNANAQHAHRSVGRIGTPQQEVNSPDDDSTIVAL
jgi:hypothetical protein